MPQRQVTAALGRCDEIAAGQEGALSRVQAKAAGLEDDHIAREISGRRWQRSRHAGVYLVHTGPVSYLSRCWSALLHAGPGAALGMETAAWMWELLEKPPPMVHVIVAADRRPAKQPGVTFHIRGALPCRVHPARLPALVRLEETVLDMVDRPETTAAQVIDWVLRACQRRLTTPHRLGQALRHRRKIRHRRLLSALLSEAEEGVQSALERDYLHKVERAHGLPPARRNRAEGRPGARRYRDNRYDRYGLVVELDGRLYHPLDEREHDDWRDAELLESDGARTVRYGWRAVHVHACRTAGQVSSLLRQGGWAGAANQCGPDCRLPGAGSR